jgi:hypothetical protein
MRSLKMLLLVLLLGVRLAHADDAPASDASIQELLEVTHSEKTIDVVISQMQASIDLMNKQFMKDRSLRPDQAQIMDDAKNQLVAAVRDSLKWEDMMPIYVDIYRKSFSQKEIDDIITFYKTETGQAILAKMPIVLQNTMQITMQRMAVLTPKLQKIQQDALAKLKASMQAE